jgi:hypothetical protein
LKELFTVPFTVGAILCAKIRNSTKSLEKNIATEGFGWQSLKGNRKALKTREKLAT